MHFVFDLRSLSVWLGRKLAGIGVNEARIMRRTAASVPQLTSSAGFTLVELLVVITILGILSSVAVFALGNQSVSASAAACRSDLQTVHTAQVAYYTQIGTYASDIDALVAARVLRSAPSNSGYQISTDVSGAVVAQPDCDSLDGSSDGAPPETPTTTQPGSQLAAACTAGAASVSTAQSDYQASNGNYAGSVTMLVKKGYLDADPSADGFKISTNNKGVVTAAPTCANISDVACNAAVSQVQAAQQNRFTQTGKYGSSVAQLVTGGYLAADPSTDAYKIKTTHKDITTSTPDCATLS